MQKCMHCCLLWNWLWWCNMGLMRLYLSVGILCLLIGGQNSNAAIIRKLQKAALHHKSLSTASSDEEYFIFGQFIGPSDTKATFDGGELISFQNNLTREGNTEWEANMNSRFSDYNSWLVCNQIPHGKVWLCC